MVNKNAGMRQTLEDGRRWNGLAYVHDKPVAGCDCGSCAGWFPRHRHLTADGKLRVQLDGRGLAEHYPSGRVIDADGEVIGEAHSYTYGGGAFAVHTPAFAGHVKFEECEFVGGAR